MGLGVSVCSLLVFSQATKQVSNSDNVHFFKIFSSIQS
jgi:hypothetical protein